MTFDLPLRPVNQEQPERGQAPFNRCVALMAGNARTRR